MIDKLKQLKGQITQKWTNGLPPIVYVPVAIALAVLSTLIFATQVAADDPPPYKIYLPMILKTSCLPTPQEQELAILMEQDANQQRASFNLSSRSGSGRP